MRNPKSVAVEATIESPPSSGPAPTSITYGDVDLADVVAFVKVVESGSFTKAAAKTALPKSALSRRVARLEQALGVRLLQRTTRTLSLTDAGSTYFERAASAMAQLAEARALAAEATHEASGVVKISVPPDLGSGPLGAVLASFATLYPNIHVEVDASARFVDLVTEGFDFALRAGRLRDSSLVAKKIGESPAVLVASPTYLKSFGTPATLADLRGHACVLFRSTKGECTWRLTGPNGDETVVVRGPLSGSDFSFVRNAALSGVGIAFVPVPASIDDIIAGRLVHVLPGYRGPAEPIHLVYPSARFIPHRVTLLRDYLVQHLRVDCPESCKKAHGAAR